MSRKTLSSADQHFADHLGKKWISILSLSAFLILGIWMLLSPETPSRSSYEKVTVALVKELWGTPMGLIITGISLPIISFISYQIYKLKQYSWIKFSNGYYLFEAQKRLKGLSSIYDGNDLIVFHPEKRTVLAFKNYTKSSLNDYRAVKKAKAFSNNHIYWSASAEGYTVIYNGENLDDKTSEWRGDDLVVKSSSKHVTILLKDYKNLKDNKVRRASRI